MTRFLIIGDLHGAMPNIYVDNNEFDAIIFPGDVCSDKALRKWTDLWIASWKETDTPYKDWEEYLVGSIKKAYDKAGKASIEEGRNILAYLASFGKPVYFIPGNWDQSYGKSSIKEGDQDKSAYHKVKSNLDAMYGKTNRDLIKGIKGIKDCQFRLHQGTDFNIIGYGNTNFPEKPRINTVKNMAQRAKVKAAYNKILNKLKQEYQKRNKKNPTIFLSHNMPYNTKLDKINNPQSPIHGQHYGSTITRDFITHKKPLVCIGGHMHEYHGKTKLGNTTIINAGFGPKVNTLLTIEQGKITTRFIQKDKRKKFNKKIGWK